MPHCRPMMNTRPQITSVEEMIRIPACRSASPKKRNTRSRNTSRDDLRGELDDLAERLDPARGVCEQPLDHDRLQLRSLDDRRDLGVRGEQRLREA